MPKNTSLPGNLEKKAVEYIKSRLDAGMSKYTLKQELLEKNYSEELANNLLQKASKKPIFPKILRVLGIILLIAAIIVGIYFAYPLAAGIFEKKCDNSQCFITAANNCQIASFQNTQAGSLFEYKTKGCVLTKTNIRVGDSEPSEIKYLLEGKSMICKYTKGNFDDNLVNSLSYGLSICTGELRDAIDIILAV